MPSARLTALDGHAIRLPEQLPGRATVLIIGFGRHSQAATTAWEKPVRLQLAHAPAISFYDMAMLAEVPGFLRTFVINRVRKAVPEVLRPNFIPLIDEEEAWKRFAGYAPDAPEAAYVVVVDSAGVARWSTHAAFTQAGYEQLQQMAQRVAGENR